MVKPKQLSSDNFFALVHFLAPEFEKLKERYNKQFKNLYIGHWSDWDKALLNKLDASDDSMDELYHALVGWQSSLNDYLPQTSTKPSAPKKTKVAKTAKATPARPAKKAVKPRSKVSSKRS